MTNLLSRDSADGKNCHGYHPPENAQALLSGWMRRARDAQVRHYAMADRLSAYGRRLGLAVIGITALTGTSSFLSLATNAVAPELRVVVGLTSMGAAVLASLQTFLRYTERADLHRRAGARYGAVRRRLEAMHVRDVSGRETAEMTAVRAELDGIAQDAPPVPRRAMRCPEPPTNSSTVPIRSRQHRDASEIHPPPA